MNFKKMTKAFGGLFSTTSTDSRRADSRPSWPNDAGVKTLDKLLKEHTRREMISFGRKLYSNYGPIRAACNDKATYSIGKAWKPLFQGKDKAWGDIATEWLTNEWYPIADITGKSLVNCLWIGSVSIDRDGSMPIVLTEGQGGYPFIQCISPALVGQTMGEVALEGRYEGRKVLSGVVVNDSGRTIAYPVMKRGGGYEYVPSENMIYLYDPEYYDQPLGWPSFSHGIETARASLTAQQAEELAHIIGSQQTLLHWSDTGGPDPSDPAFMGQSTTGDTGVQFRKSEDGQVRIFSANSKGMEMFQSDRPGTAWESFQDRLVRHILAGMGWPYELTWKASELTGPSVRLRIGQAMRAVEDRQTLMEPSVRRIIGYAISKAIKIGRLPPSDEWYKWGFTLPPKLTIDVGRESMQVREDLKFGVRTWADVIGETGGELRNHFEQRAKEYQLAKKISEQTGVPIEQIISTNYVTTTNNG